MGAALLLDERVEMPDGAVVEVRVWRLPEPLPGSTHGFKYRLYFGRKGRCLVRYDNESGKGDRRHIGGKEKPCRFVSVRRLRDDFWADVLRAGGYDEPEKPGKPEKED